MMSNTLLPPRPVTGGEGESPATSLHFRDGSLFLKVDCIPWNQLVLLVPWNGASNLKRASVPVNQVYLSKPYCKWAPTFSVGVESSSLGRQHTNQVFCCQSFLD
ncbi:hypothetical protein P8452_31797 [Trifolium repens]|nr:hypothetical protein P8452_31797 [Trifolium repens]